MELSRREFLRYAGGAGAGTALGGIVGLGLSLAPARARAQELRIRDSTTVPSICPFCSVGCATLIHVKGGEIINIEGDPRSPHNEGTLCPTGAIERLPDGKVVNMTTAIFALGGAALDNEFNHVA